MSKEKKKRIKRYPWKCSVCGRAYESLDPPPISRDTNIEGVTVKICAMCDWYIDSHYHNE